MANLPGTTIYSPSSSFLFGERERHANDFIGDLRFGVDYRLHLVPSGTPGNAYIYKSTGDDLPVRAFIAGQVVAVESRSDCDGQKRPDAICGDQAADTASTTEILVVGVSPSATEPFKTRCRTDLAALLDVLASERSKARVVAQSWAKTSSDDPGEEGEIYVQLGAFTKAPYIVEVGRHVLVDVTLHRQDTRIGDLLGETYTLVAHDIETVDDDWLRSVKLLEGSPSAAWETRVRNAAHVGNLDLDIQMEYLHLP